MSLPAEPANGPDAKGVLLSLFSPMKIVKIAVVLVGVVLAHLAAFAISGVVERLVRKSRVQDKSNKQSTADAARRSVAFSLAGTAAYWVTLVLFMAIVLALGGVRLAAMAAIIGSLLFALGLGLQGTLSDIAAGVMLIAMGTYGIGDFIEVNSEDARGTVVDFTVLYTRLMDEDSGVSVILPNRTLYGAVLVNHSSAQRYIVLQEFAVSNQNESLVDAMADVVDVIRTHPAVLETPPVTCNVARVEPLATIVEVRFAMAPDDAHVNETSNKPAEVASLVRDQLMSSGVQLVELGGKEAAVA